MAVALRMSGERRMRKSVLSLALVLFSCGPGTQQAPVRSEVAQTAAPSIFSTAYDPNSKFSIDLSGFKNCTYFPSGGNCYGGANVLFTSSNGTLCACSGRVTVFGEQPEIRITLGVEECESSVDGAIQTAAAGDCADIQRETNFMLQGSTIQMQYIDPNSQPQIPQISLSISP